MTPTLMVFEDFFPEKIIENITKILRFGPVLNEVDGVTYDGIDPVVPKEMRAVIDRHLKKLFGKFTISHQFFRLMTGETKQSLIHEDSSMGRFSLHVYLSPPGQNRSGTQFWDSEVFGSSRDKMAEIDQTKFFNPAQWSRAFFVRGKYNRALIHRSDLWHSAEPCNGYGRHQFDGRVVLTTFFS